MEKGIIVTRHAEQRAQQRGVRLNSIHIAAKYGKKTRAREGLFVHVFNRACFARALADGCSVHELDNALNLPVVCDSSDRSRVVVVTTLPKAAKLPRVYKYKDLSNER